jgi:hypothetical protein
LFWLPAFHRVLHGAIVADRIAIVPDLIAMPSDELFQIQTCRFACGAIRPGYPHLQVLVDYIFMESVENVEAVRHPDNLLLVNLFNTRISVLRNSVCPHEQISRLPINNVVEN